MVQELWKILVCRGLQKESEFVNLHYIWLIKAFWQVFYVLLKYFRIFSGFPQTDCCKNVCNDDQLKFHSKSDGVGGKSQNFPHRSTLGCKIIWILLPVATSQNWWFKSNFVIFLLIFGWFFILFLCFLGDICLSFLKFHITQVSRKQTILCFLSWLGFLLGW